MLEEKMTPEQFADRIKSELEKTKGEVTAEIETKLKDFASKSDENATLVKELEESVKSQGETIALLKEKMSQKQVQQLDCTKTAIKEAMIERFDGMSSDAIKAAIEDHKFVISVFKDGTVAFGTKSDVEKFNTTYETELKKNGVKSASSMTLSGNVTGTAVRRAPNVWDVAPKNQPFLRDFATVAPTSYAQIPVTSLVNLDGDAGWTAEGAVKPLRDGDLVVAEKSSKKITVFATMSNEIIDDIDMMLSQIEIDLLQQVALKEEDGELFGTGANDDPIGVFDSTVASAYTITTLNDSVPSANEFDAIRAAYTQLALLNHYPTEVFISPVDSAKMDLTKTSDNAYILPPFTTSDGMIVKGVRIIEKNQIPAGYFGIGDFKKVEIFDYKPLTIEMGYNGEDFKYNRISLRAEKRVIMYVKANNANAFIYDTFANVIGAINEAEA